MWFFLQVSEENPPEETDNTAADTGVPVGADDMDFGFPLKKKKTKKPKPSGDATQGEEEEKGTVVYRLLVLLLIT